MMRALLVYLLSACAATPNTPVPHAGPAPSAQPQRQTSSSADAHAPAPPPVIVAADTATPLRTRAHPLALYVARMHRKLHQQWADAFLASLDQKLPTDPLNDPGLAVELEIAIDAQGNADVQVVTPSHVLAFDHAAVEAFRASAPFDPTPATFRSSDDRLLLRWTLYRDQRECGTANVVPLYR